ncbi:hypothetical protein [Kitasatospora sp. NPDC059571]|uniref:hypothetical protein n=1 Tax=Kitasatospora sp. NPDC059571 TaxID=3346871 RepID=UPI0036843525
MNRLPRPSAAGLLRALREWPGWFTLAGGAVLCVLGWYGVSGESLAARQLPYLASATAPGAALIVAGAVLVAARQGRGGGGPADRRLDQLYALLVAEAPAAEADPDTAGAAVVLPHGTLYHRPDCPLAAGKSGAERVDAAAVRERGLGPCPVCDPEPPAGAGPATGPEDSAGPEPPAGPGPPPAPGPPP